MKKIANWKLYCIFCVAVLSRVVLFGKNPGGINVDEAFAGYEAYSIANFGLDSWGYKRPIYLATWGSGMSALNSYLMIPFVTLWGLNSVTIRLPQVILGTITIYVFYRLIKKIANDSIAYWGTFLLAISPWHIMMCRYGMDCNLTPAFIVLGVYFAILGIERNRYLLISAVFWGLSLYAYALNWLFVPIFLSGCLIYCIKYKKLNYSSQLIISGIILFVFAVPLLLFVAVNIGITPEIKSSFISIPKLVAYRGNEISLKNILANFIKLIKLFITQDDYLIWNNIKGFGIYYLYSTPIVIYGGYAIIKKIIVNLKQKKFCYEFIIAWWIVVGIFVGLLQGIGINRINAVIPGAFIILATGMYELCNKCIKYVKQIIVVVYIISFLLFELVYFGEYQEQISNRQNIGAKEAIEYALTVVKEDEDIYVVNAIRHSQVLFYTQYPVNDYIESVEWTMEAGAREVYVQRFDKFCWDWNMESIDAGVYIILAEDIEKYKEQGYSITRFQSCAVAVK